MLAPDTAISPAHCGLNPSHWRRFEAVGAREIERVSLTIARQEFEYKRKMKVQQAIKELDFLKQAEVNARLRRAMNYSKNDVVANLKQEQRWGLRRDAAIAVIASELDPSHAFDPTKRNTALEIELRESSTSPLAHVGGKKVGLT